jgi:hypothetical protein
MTDEQMPQEGKPNEIQGTPGATPAQGQQATNVPQWVLDNPAEAYRQKQEANQEAAALRVKLREFEDKETKRQQEELAAKGEWEQLARQREEALTARDRELQNARLEAAVIAVAAKAGFVDPSEAWALVDRNKIGYTDGKAEGVDVAITELAKAKPHLLRSTSSAPALPDHNPSGITGQSDVSERVKSMVREQVRGGPGKAIGGAGVVIHSTDKD